MKFCFFVKSFFSCILPGTTFPAGDVVVSANFEQGDGITKTIQELDISSKTGNVFAWFLNGNSSAACIYKVFKVWLE